ncbi:MAG TPA: IS1595 family transposase [Bryobacteraceae bacterium]|jgi:transposase-like protein|nr:IS1595 family transposase [Bryobacteraceae bacterium]
MADEPKTLQEAILYFSDPANCREYLMARRWPDGATCPRCTSKDVIYLEKYNRWHCRAKHEAPQFTLKTGTIMEDSPIPLSKWLMVIWQIVNSKNGISSYEVKRAIGITQKSAWFLEHRIRLALANGTLDKMSGDIEADETFVGGKTNNMHRNSKRKRQAMNDGNWGKTIVLGLLQREGQVRAAVAPSRHKHQVHSNILANVEPGSKLYTDEFNSYDGLPASFTREVINHLQGYVNGKISTNQMENFWSLLKRGLKGTYVSVDPAHLQAYVDEQVFRFNNRKDADGKSLTDADRFDVAVRQIVGKRLTWNDLINKEAVASSN